MERWGDGETGEKGRWGENEERCESVRRHENENESRH